MRKKETEADEEARKLREKNNRQRIKKDVLRMKQKKEERTKARGINKKQEEINNRKFKQSVSQGRNSRRARKTPPAKTDTIIKEVEEEEGKEEKKCLADG
ncbi:hypothetical protein Pcinc_006833 [Petrolisthes cinctipes]|uniref:Uncharacterized protein n=1 Tax=Petrolisthes cinctipes TaxID=88211 RepID=A0AAE1GC60_PETCI|nr:hypothetical protein Pcinc_006833 [Petrolisthes cinctipes]